MIRFMSRFGSLRRAGGAFSLGLALGLVVVLAAQFAMAAPTFPKLTGRVVDDAGVLSDATEADITKASEALEAATGHQFVVATVKSLNDMEIEDYSILLARKWAIGREKQDDGVVLLVAPIQRKVRIEVGYGLENVLTNQAAKAIIDNRIVPRFKAGDINGGVSDGAKAIIDKLNTVNGGQVTTSPSLPASLSGSASAPAPAASSGGASAFTGFLVLLVVILLFLLVRGRRQQPVMMAQGPMMMPPQGYGPGYAPSYGPAYGFGGYGGGMGMGQGFGRGVATGAAGMYLWDHRNSLIPPAPPPSFSGGGGSFGGGSSSSSSNSGGRGFSFSSGGSDSSSGHGGGGSFGGGGASGSW